jgi:hypothetical protein
VLLAAHGAGASRQERWPVVSDASWSSCLRLKESGAASLHRSVGGWGGEVGLVLFDGLVLFEGLVV